MYSVVYMDILVVLSVGAIGMTCGFVAMIPGIMAFDAGENTKPSMRLLGVSSLSIIPITVISTTLTIVTLNPAFMALHALPIAGMGVAFVADQYYDKRETSSPPNLAKPSKN